MMRPCKVSIIVPFFNVSPYFAQCLASIAAQTHPDIEVILVNDGSTDDSATIAQTLTKKDERFTLFTIDNRGPAAARNYGMQQATGEWIQFVDADDRIQETMTASLLQQVTDKVDLVICGYEGKQVMLPSLVGSYEQKAFLQRFGLLFLEGVITSPCNKLYRRSLIEKHGLQFPLDYRLGEDLMFQLSYLQNCRHISLLAEALYIYQERKGSFSKTYIPNYLHLQNRLYENCLAFLQKTDTATRDNLSKVQYVFAQHFRHATSNLFHPDHEMTWQGKNILLHEALRSEQLKKMLPFYQTGIDQGLFRYFLQSKPTRLAALYFATKEWIRYYIRKF